MVIHNLFSENPEIQQEPNEYMKSFQESVFKTRKDLLQLHWENPGLFREIVRLLLMIK